MKENINAINELNKGATMGMDSINFILEKVKNKEFKKELLKEYAYYEEISVKANELYKEYSKNSPQETNLMTKAMTWYGVEMRTMLDKSDSKIAELMLQGTNMGIIEGRKILNNKKVDTKIIKLLNAFVKIQEKNVEEIKKYL